jgi:hypothetical protein
MSIFGRAKILASGRRDGYNNGLDGLDNLIPDPAGFIPFIKQEFDKCGATNFV